jgi:hypothetical protein
LNVFAEQPPHAKVNHPARVWLRHVGVRAEVAHHSVQRDRVAAADVRHCDRVQERATAIVSRNVAAASAGRTLWDWPHRPE